VLHELHVFLNDHKAWVIIFSAILAVYYGRHLVLGLIADHKAKSFKGAPVKPTTGAPPMGGHVVKPPKRSQDEIKTEIAPSMLEIGAAARLSKAVAQTAKMAPIQDHGHGGTTRTETPRRPVDDKISQFFANPDDKQPAAPISPTGAANAETIKTSASSSAAPAPELDVILARLDKVLTADKSAEHAKPAAAPTGDKKPIWASADAFDDDLDDEKPQDGAKQLGLFDNTDDKK
jgi:hypothetical protein